MPRHINPADTDPAFAVALGRFAEAVAVLEREVENALMRLLPVTDEIGRVLLSGNMMRRNSEIMRALALLPDVPIPDDLRNRITSEFFPEITAINDDRSRFLHNPAIETDTAGKFALVVHKADAKNSSLMYITTDLLNTRATDAESLAWKLMIIPSVDYDLSKWTKAFSKYPIRPYPKAQSPNPKHPRAQKQKSQKK